MTEQQQFKRNIAFKLRIGDVLMGKPITEGERFSNLELGDKKIVRVNVIGNIVDKYNSEGETKFTSLTFDDGSGQIKLKFFGDDVEKFKEVSQGQTVLVIGVLRNWNNETYIQPEIIKEQDTNTFLSENLKLKRKNKTPDPVGRDQIVAVKDKILNTIKNAEEDGGIEMDKVIMNLRDISPTIINQEVQKLLEEGIVFEPRPGRVRYLG